MTDAEADKWYEEHADATMERTVGMMSFQLWRRGKKAEADPTVGFVFPVNMTPPFPLEARRFLVRWFVQVYGE